MSHHRLEVSHGSTEIFLEVHGTRVLNDLDWTIVPENYVAVIWIRNAEDAIALIITGRNSLKRTRCSTDKRARKTYLVPIKDLLPLVDRDCAEDLRQLLTASET